MVNNRTKSMGKLTSIGQKLGFENTIYFLSKIGERISDRIRHIFLHSQYAKSLQNRHRTGTQYC